MRLAEHADGGEVNRREYLGSFLGRLSLLAHAAHQLEVRRGAVDRLAVDRLAGVILDIVVVAALAETEIRRVRATVRFQQSGEDVELKLRTLAAMLVKVVDRGLRRCALEVVGAFVLAHSGASI